MKLIEIGNVARGDDHTGRSWIDHRADRAIPERQADARHRIDLALVRIQEAQKTPIVECVVMGLLLRCGRRDESSGGECGDRRKGKVAMSTHRLVRALVLSLKDAGTVERECWKTALEMIQFESTEPKASNSEAFLTVRPLERPSDRVQKLMKKIALATIIATLPVAGVAAEPNSKSARKPADTKGQTSTKSRAKPCAEYGEGYVRLEGSSTCVKVSGYVRFQTGRSR